MITDRYYDFRTRIKFLLREGFVNNYREINGCDCCKYFDYSSVKNMYNGLEHPIYNMINKGKLYKLNHISPKEYLTIVSNNFGETYENMINSNVIDKSKISEYVEDMKRGDKFPIIFYTVGKSIQEGRHRALACLTLGCRMIPVVSIENIDYGKLPMMLSKFRGFSFDEVDSYFKYEGYYGISELDYRELTKYFDRID